LIPAFAGGICPFCQKLQKPFRNILILGKFAEYLFAEYCQNMPESIFAATLVHIPLTLQQIPLQPPRKRNTEAQFNLNL
jgi:hypothetical protein